MPRQKVRGLIDSSAPQDVLCVVKVKLSDDVKFKRYQAQTMSSSNDVRRSQTSPVATTSQENRQIDFFLFQIVIANL
jgi:hypothetical protein